MAALKRKRSFPSFSSPLTATTTTDFFQHDTPPSMPFFYGQSKSTWATSLSSPMRPCKMDMEGEARHLNSRTRKRYRDNRPDQEEIHANTLNKLFAAQRAPASSDSTPSQSLDPSRADQVYPSQRDSQSTQAQSTKAPQQSLHRFWTQLPPQPSSQQSTDDIMMDTEPSGPIPNRRVVTNCEGCGNDIPFSEIIGDGGLSDQDDEIDRAIGCRACGRRVCDYCAVQGWERRCLECATHGI